MGNSIISGGSVVIVDENGNTVDLANRVYTTLKVGDTTAGNYFEVESDGTKVLNGNATTWTDMSIPATRARQGATQKPDFDFTNMGLLFPQNDDTEIAYIIIQMDHRKKMDTAIKLHCHYVQAVAAQPTFKCDYRFYNNGTASNGSFTTLSTADGSKGVFTYPGSGEILQIATFPDIAAPTNESVSANLEFRFYRDDNDVTGDVLLKYIDFHYEIDTDGSRQEFIK